MSERIQAAIERDAAAVEAENPDEEEAKAEEAESEPEPEPEPEPSGEPSDLAMRKFEQEAARHERALAKIMGDDFAMFGPCPECNTLGFAPLDGPPDAPNTERCGTCLGYGQLVSGSRNAATVLISCTECTGMGYKTRAMPLAVVPQYQPPTAASDQPYPGYGLAFVPLPSGIPDQYGRPAGHPHWGLDPSVSAA